MLTERSYQRNTPWVSDVIVVDSVCLFVFVVVCFFLSFGHTQTKWRVLPFNYICFILQFGSPGVVRNI